MAHIAGTDRTQAVLLPEVLDDYVRPDNPVRFLDAFVAQLDLAALGFQRAVPAETGRPGYDPGDLLRLYLYGYLHRIRSSRRLEQETHRNVELMWLLRRLTPDFTTIADFRRDHPEALKGVCRECILLCRRLDLFGGELLAIDGSKFRAVKRGAIRPPRDDAQAQQRAFNRFRAEYNDERPHASLGGQTPASQYRPAPRPYPRILPPQEYPGHFLGKKITTGGTFRFQRRLLFIANSLTHHHIGLEETDDGIWSIYFNTVLLAKLAERDCLIRG